MRYLAHIATVFVVLTLTNLILASPSPAFHELSPVLQQRLVVFEDFSSSG